jgi:hypothetical protein
MAMPSDYHPLVFEGSVDYSDKFLALAMLWVRILPGAMREILICHFLALRKWMHK